MTGSVAIIRSIVSVARAVCVGLSILSTLAGCPGKAPATAGADPAGANSARNLEAPPVATRQATGIPVGDCGVPGGRCCPDFICYTRYFPDHRCVTDSVSPLKGHARPSWASSVSRASAMFS
jgi:hypothetical protein